MNKNTKYIESLNPELMPLYKQVSIYVENVHREVFSQSFERK